MPLSEEQKKVSRIRGGSRALVTTMGNEADQLETVLKDKSSAERSVNLNDMARRIERVRSTLKLMNQRFEAAEDPDNPLTEDEWIREISVRDEYDRKLDALDDLQQRLRGLDKSKEEDPASVASDIKSDSMTRLLEQLIKVQQLSANTAALQQLPPVNVRTFGGDSLQFLQFWSEFKSTVHDKETLPAVTKFRHLRQLLTGKAAAAVEGIPVTGENYPKAIDYLIRRYGDPQQITINIFTELLDATQGKEIRLRQLIDQVNNAVATLQSLRISQEYYSLILYPLLLKAISRSLSLRFINSRSPASNDHRGTEARVDTDDDDHGEDMETFLEDIVIPEDLPKAFNSNFKDLLAFLTREAQAREQQDQLCGGTKSGSQKKKDDQQKAPKQVNRDAKSEQSSQVYAVAASKGKAEKSGKQKTDKCLICDLDHFTARCKEDIPVDQKILKVESANACVRCLRLGHKAADCSKREVLCPRCKGEHYSVLCPVKVIASVVQDGNSLLPTGHVRVLGDADTKVIARFLMDTGSQRTFVTSDLVRKLNIPSMSHEWITVYTFGSSDQAKPDKLPVVSLRIRVPEGSSEFRALVVPAITGSAPPQIPTFLRKKSHLSFAELVDGPTKIDILFGASDAMKLLQGSLSKVGDFTLMNSQVGQVVVGPQYSVTNSTNATATAALTPKVSLEDFWKLEHLGILPHELTQSEETDKLIKVFHETVKRLPTGQYETILNLNEEKLGKLGDNQSLALRQAKTLIQKFQKDHNLCEAYAGEIQTFIDSDFAEKLPEGEKAAYFMPHFPVVNLSRATTKVRPVFNASSHVKNALSLNECVRDCPNLLPTAMDTLIKFRSFPIALTGDISKAYLRIGIQKEFRNYLCFYWLNDPKCLQSGFQIYRMKVNTFGLKDAQFNMIMTIRSHAEKYRAEHPRAVEALLADLYSDDLLSGGDTEVDVLKLQSDISSILKEAGLEMKKWRANSDFFSKTVGCQSSPEATIMSQTQVSEKVLGIVWCNREDIFRFESKNLKEFVSSGKYTKRVLLGALPRLYDPAGFISPFTMQLKLILQAVHKSKCGLDAPLPSELTHQWLKWIGELEELDKFCLPRFYGLRVPQGECRTELHLFVDASEKAYAAVIYIKVISKTDSVSHLLVSKARTVPIKQVDTLTIPKKELLAALCGARLLNHVVTTLKLISSAVFCWTDSANVLAWIQSPRELTNVFVKNRVREIRNLTVPSTWHHVAGIINPADLPSRGVPLSKLINNPLWLHGPDLNHVVVGNLSPHQESSVLPTMQATEPTTFFPIEKYSVLHRGVRVMAWMRRFINNVRKRIDRSMQFSVGTLTADELLSAKQLLIRQAQVRCFGEDRLESQRLKTMNMDPFIDEMGILRLRGRLENLDVPRGTKEPILLADDHLTRLLIAQEHGESSLHLKTEIVLTRLRRHFWILRGRQLVRTVIHHCGGCRRGRALPCRACPEGVLPVERVEVYKVFQNVGVDYAGPFIIKDRSKNESKVWVVLFSCCVTRAVYLDLVEDQSALSFLLALKRFVASHGAVEKIISDNALCFTKADKVLKSLWANLKDPSVQNYFGKAGIKWSFNPPRAAWYGGHFERLIGLMKSCLRHAMRQRKLQFVHFLTILKEIEAIMNSRPLTVVNVDVEAPEPLTPGHFLSGRIPLTLPSGSLTGVGKTELAKVWRLREQTVKSFWKRWKSEYIVLLRTANRRVNANAAVKALNIGDVVIIKDEALNRQFWQLGCVRECIQSRDKQVRKYSVRTAHGDLIRDGKHLFKLIV